MSAVRRVQGRRAAVDGFTLVEVMVALAVGLAVVAGLVAAHVAAVRNGRRTEALVQVTEDATLALAVLRQQVAQAGFGLPRGGPGLVLPAFPAVRGCEAGAFADLQAAITAAGNCAAPGRDASASDTLEVAYEAAVQAGPSANAILGGASAREPLDCVGNTFGKTADAAAGDYWLQDSKFYVADGSLMCHGPGNAAGAAVVQNVEALQVVYGMATAPAGESGAGQVVYYDTAPSPGSSLWANVVVVGVCVQVRSAAKVLGGAASTLGGWVDCAGVARTATDGYLRRSFATTIVLQDGRP